MKYFTLLNLLVLLCSSCRQVANPVVEPSQPAIAQYRTNAFYNTDSLLLIDELKDTLKINERKILMNLGVCFDTSDLRCNTNEYFIVKYDDKDVLYSNFLIFDYTGGENRFPLVEVYINKERIANYGGNLYGYYTDRKGAKVPILDIDNRRDKDAGNSYWYSDCRYRLAANYLIVRAKWTENSFGLDSILSVDFGTPIERCFYDSLAKLYLADTLPPPKSSELVSIDNFRQIRVQKTYTSGCFVLDSSFCCAIDSNLNCIDKLKGNRINIRLRKAKGILSVLPPIEERYSSSMDLFSHEFSCSANDSLILISKYAYSKGTIVVSSVSEPYHIYNHLIGYLSGYYSQPGGCLAFVVEHDVAYHNRNASIVLLYKWQQKGFVADSILSVSGLPVPPNERDSLNRVYIRTNPFEKIKAKK